MNYSLLAEDLFSNLVKTSNAPFRKQTRDFCMGETGILFYLLYHPDGVNAGELSEQLDITTGRVATALNTLEKKKMIKRISDLKDKRKVIIHITDMGKHTVLTKQRRGIGCVEELLQKLGEEDAGELARIMRRLITF